MAHLRTIEQDMGWNFNLRDDQYFRVEGCQVYLPRQWHKVMVLDLWQTEEDIKEEEDLKDRIGNTAFGHTSITYQ